MEALGRSNGGQIKLQDMVRLLNNPKFMLCAEEDIIAKLKASSYYEILNGHFDLEKKLQARQAAAAVAEMGGSLEVQERVYDTELKRFLAGGLPFCSKPKECGHRCGGVKGEGQCLPCLEPDCIAAAGESDSLLPATDELCSICYTSEVREEPSVQLTCGHVFHVGCILQLLKHKWSTLRITFAFMGCPSCKQPIQAGYVEEIDNEIMKLTDLRNEVQTKAAKVAMEQGLDKDERLKMPGDFYYNNLTAYAEAKVSFFMCAKCIKPYFGGLIDCEQEMGMENTTRKEDLMCGPCLMTEMSIGSSICKRGHGANFIDWKCMFCCSTALFLCGGNMWYCDRCHDEGGKTIRDCKGKNCPLKIPHPPASRDPKKSSFPLGCSLCRAEHLKDLEKAQVKIKAVLKEVVPTKGWQSFDRDAQKKKTAIVQPPKVKKGAAAVVKGKQGQAAVDSKQRLINARAQAAAEQRRIVQRNAEAAEQRRLARRSEGIELIEQFAKRK